MSPSRPPIRHSSPFLLFLTTFLCLSPRGTVVAGAYKEHQPSDDSKCERITVPLCSDVLYNYTRFPNMLGHLTQHKAAADIEHFKPLIHASCSKNLRFFICSIYTPMCTEAVNQAVTSCRSVCEEVRRDCHEMLKNFGLNWPAMLNCTKFPKFPEDLCMQPDKTDSQDYPPERASPFPHGAGGGGRGGDYPPPLTNCYEQFVDLDPHDPGSLCAPVCDGDLMFSRNDKRFAETWMAIWSCLCLAVTAFTVLTCCLDRSRFKFPERSIIYLAACYLIYSLGYIARLFLTSEEVSCQKTSKNGKSYLISGGLDNAECVIIFIILYYFSMASSIWWVVLTFTWYLAAGKKWVHEAIEAYSSYFHLVAWGVPALLSVSVLITHKVDSSELTGLCFVGYTNAVALGGFVIIPLAVLLLLGIAFIIAGFVAMCSVRKTLQTQGTNISKLEKLMVKIGIFSVLYVIPAICIIACYAYHALVLLHWKPMTTMCKSVDNGREPTPRCTLPMEKPQVQVYMLQIFMSLIVGITSGMWVSSRKTCDTWTKCICCGRFKSPIEKSGPASAPLCQNLTFETGMGTQAFSVRPTGAYPPSFKTGSSGGSRKYVPPTDRRFYPVSASSEATKV